MGGSGGHCGSGGGVKEVSNGFPCQEILLAVKIVKAYRFFSGGGGGGGGVGSSGSGGLMVGQSEPLSRQIRLNGMLRGQQVGQWDWLI